MGYTKDQVISDVLDAYDQHIMYLTMSDEIGTATGTILVTAPDTWDDADHVDPETAVPDPVGPGTEGSGTSADEPAEPAPAEPGPETDEADGPADPTTTDLAATGGGTTKENHD